MENYNLSDFEQFSKIIDDYSLITPAITGIKITEGKYNYPQHIKFIDREITLSILNHNAKIIINMPPRHGKSELISKYLPFWFLGHFPQKRIILATYEAKFAASYGKKVRDLIRDYGTKYFGISLDDSSRSVSSFMIKKLGGGMDTAGIGGPLTGKGADLLIIDDPIKNDMEANSPTFRDKVWDWFLATAYTRLEPNGNILIIMTRWHEDDLVGRIINSKDAYNWKKIVLPALAEENDILNRDFGEPLWSDRFSRTKLLETKKLLGEYWFSALYQQRPAPKDGTIFHKKNFCYFTYDENYYYIDDFFRYSSYLINELNYYVAIDFAISLNQHSDYTAAIVATKINDGKILIIDVIRQKIQGSQHLEFIKSIYDKYKPKLIGIESVQFQLSIIQQAQSLGYPVIKLKADKDKFSRALPIASKMESKLVYFKKDAVWLESFERELIEFPYGKNDDMVDALAYIERIISPQSNFSPLSIERKY